MLNQITVPGALLAAVMVLLTPTTILAENATCTVTSLVIETEQDVLTFAIEVAATPESREFGLMNRTGLPTDAGMLFVFPPDTSVAFWMKNTLIPLDMLFVDETGVISFIKHNAQPNDLTPVPSKSGIKARAVLEINGGLARNLGIIEGSTVSPVWITGGAACSGI